MVERKIKGMHRKQLAEGNYICKRKPQIETVLINCSNPPNYARVLHISVFKMQTQATENF